MTSKQVMLIAAGIGLAGCSWIEDINPFARDRGIDSPYTSRRVWAVVPLRNESGSLEADGAHLADHLAGQFENVPNVEVMPVNRTITAMEALGLDQITSPGDARSVMETINADGLVVGSITAYDPYVPPKLGLAIELYTSGRSEQFPAQDPRDLVKSATPITPTTRPSDAARRQPASTVSGYYDAAEQLVRLRLKRYAKRRGPIEDADAWHRYLISMDLYSQFIAHVMCERLMKAESGRHARLMEAAKPAS